VIYAMETGSGGMTYIQIFMKIFRGVLAILRLFLSNLKCNIGIIAEKI
jgi:hypothetical protein